MSEIRFYILTRTSGRPHFFQRCCASLNQQTYKNFKHLVCTDDRQSLAYIRDLGIEPILVNKIDKNVKISNPIMSSPYNLYLNHLYNYVDDGFVIFLDDDDEFESEKSLETIAYALNSSKGPIDTLLFWKVAFSNGLILPKIFDNNFLRPRNVSGIGFAFHSKYIFSALWDEFKECDFRVAHKLSLVVPNKLSLNSVMTKIQRASGMGGFGSKDDLDGVSNEV